ncbi:PiggyBac transposable element-derived protein 4, partial [Geodia barretti]
MIGFKGRLTFIQYMPKKPTKWGLKAYVLADSTTGYMYNWILYTGKDDSLGDPLGMTAAVVLRLVEPISGLGHHIYMDNFYTSPALFLRLRSLGFGACRTLRLTRRGVPAEAKMRLEKGERRLVPVDEG